MNLIKVSQQFGTEEACLDFLEKLRWPNGVACVKCNGTKISKFSTKPSERHRNKINKRTGVKETVVVPVPARHLYECLTCGHQFTATAGTIFHDTHLPLHKWFLAITLMCNAKKGLSAKQLQRDLDIGSYKNAWHLAHRIRQAMFENNGESWLTGTVELDETYLGGRFDKRRKRDRYEKIPVVGMLQRAQGEKCSKVRAFAVNKANGKRVTELISENVNPLSTLHTDESPLYDTSERVYKRKSVIHINKEWVRGDVHTNGIESFWSLVERGVIGQFHQISWKHLHRYLAEFSYRFNNRDQEGTLFVATLIRMLIISNLPYAHLTAKLVGPSLEFPPKGTPPAPRPVPDPKPETIHPDFDPEV